MQKNIYNIVGILCLLATVILGCNKPDMQKPGPGNEPEPGANAREVLFSLELQPGTAAPRQDFYAEISITTHTGQPVLTNKKLNVLYNATYRTAQILLSPGLYRVSKLLVFSGANTIEYAAPVSGSIKAPEVPSPLSQNFTVGNAQNDPVVLRAIKVKNGETPAMFGYPDDAFLPLADPAGNIKIKVRTAITVGDVVYDSIPASLTLTTRDQENASSVKFISLRPGTNEITLDKNAREYHLKVSCWNLSDEITLNATEVEEGQLYTLGGSRPARKLSSVSTARLMNGTYRANTRKLYEYFPDGRIRKIIHQEKDAQNATQLSLTEEISYSSPARIQGITRKYPNGTTHSEDIFEYLPNGWLQNITRTEPDNVTRANINFLPAAGSSGITQNYLAGAEYTFTRDYYTQTFQAEFLRGNISTDVTSTSHGNLVSGWYEYDFNINPYHHLKLPDLFLENSWKHNRVSATRHYTNTFPEKIAYETSYGYDAEGYPTEMITKYKSYQTGAFLYQERTVFTY